LLDEIDIYHILVVLFSKYFGYIGFSALADAHDNKWGMV
jgi:hypothetical protein